MYPLQLVHAHMCTPSFSCLHSATFIEGGGEGKAAMQARKLVYVRDTEMLVIGKTFCEQLVPFCTALWPK